MVLFKCTCCGETVRAEPMTKGWFKCVVQGQKLSTKKQADHHSQGYKVTHPDGKVSWIDIRNNIQLDFKHKDIIVTTSGE